MTRRAYGMWMVVGLAILAGCWSPSAHTFSRNYSLREDLPADPPGACDDRDALEGGRLYKIYCGACHNARPLSERPFANNDVTLAHMREQAYLTGREYRQILHFMRRWHDLGPPTPDVPPSPKRLTFPQPIGELRSQNERPTEATPQQP